MVDVFIEITFGVCVFHVVGDAMAALRMKTTKIYNDRLLREVTEAVARAEKLDPLKRIK